MDIKLQKLRLTFFCSLIQEVHGQSNENEKKKKTYIHIDEFLENPHKI
jgi:hypothetical protein